MRLRTKYTQRLPVAPGLRLDIPMFEGSGAKVLDISGKGNHGTITDALWTRDKNGVAMSFNGTSAYIDCGNDPSLNITDAITIEAWVKGKNFNYDPIVGHLDATTGWDMFFYTDTLNVNVRGETGTVSVTGEIDVSSWVDQWHHILFTYHKTEGLKVYIDGSFIIEKTAKGKIISPVENLQIGHRPYYGTTNYFDGAIDEVRIYAVALTAEQIKRRYEQTKRDYVRGS